MTTSHTHPPTPEEIEAIAVTTPEPTTAPIEIDVALVPPDDSNTFAQSDGLVTAPIEPPTPVIPLDDVIVADAEPEVEITMPPPDKNHVFLQSMTKPELDTLIAKRLEVLGEDEFVKQILIPGSYDNLLQQLLSSHSIEADIARTDIDRIIDKTLFAEQLVQDGKIVLRGILTPRSLSGNGKSVSGPEGRYAFAIKSGQMRRVLLYNSGFFVDVVAASIEDLNTFFTRAHSDTNEYGREFGAAFFYFNDLMIKEAIVDLILPLIRNSNLKGWDRDDTLIQQIKLIDLKVILNAIASLMYPDGYEYTHVCSNPLGTCNHSESLLIDIGRFVKYDFAKLSSDSIKYMQSHAEVTVEQVAAYQKTLNFGSRTARWGRHGFDLKLPSIADYLTYGRIYNAELIGKNFIGTPMSLYQGLVHSFYRIYTPFVHSVTLYENDNPDKSDVVAYDIETIADQLGYLQGHDRATRTLMHTLDGFIADSTITSIAYWANPCPSCKYVPPGKYHTVDPEQTFFIQSLTKLTQI